MVKKRSRWELIYDVLKVTYEEKKSKKTRIMQRAYLDWRNFQKYFELLIDKGFIAKCNSIPDNYEITEKGMKLLERLRKVDEIRIVGEMLG
ncbi:Winged helix-turn-helix [uncultured archaeon]|nr:Winged helix-turn-helix [uncultured archaeon]